MLFKRPNGRSHADGNLNRGRQRGGFTLIELLVVIAIISLLLSILLPALTRVKEAGKRAQCLSNVRSLATAWTVYVEESDGRIPRGITSDAGWIRVIPGYATNPEDAPAALQLEALENGLLYPYLDTTKVFRCPVAQPNELRTYSMTHAMNGEPATAAYGGTILQKVNEIRNTGNRILFLDDYIFDWDACWMIFDDRPQWWNTTPIRHGSGGNVFSFADSHAEFWSWRDQRTVDLAEMCYEAGSPEAYALFPSESHQEGNPDLVRMQVAVWGKTAY